MNRYIQKEIKRTTEGEARRLAIKGVKNIKLFQLSVEDVEALVKVYKKDFLMFGYSPEQYKEIAVKE